MRKNVKIRNIKKTEKKEISEWKKNKEEEHKNITVKQEKIK